PDLRYDTLIHLMKANVSNPAQSAFWEIEIPNGPYIVHIVAGDPDNADANADHFQFDVEGVVTSMYAPSATPPIAHWADFVVNASVSDGRLTIKSGPLALNNKISFVDIYPDIPVPPIISVNPQSQAVDENRPVSLSVTLSQGSPTLSYQWYFNDAPLADATNRTLVFPHIPTSAQGNYYLIVTNYGGAATSTVATVTVSEDNTPPSIVSIGSLDGLTIGVCFDEELDPTGAVELGNYAINEGTANITNIIRRLDGRSVALQIDAPITGPFTVQVFSLADLSGNLADGVGASNIVAGLSTGDIGNPLRLGSHYTCDNETIELAGGGTDIWNAADQFHYAYKSIAGDFDAKVRVTSLAGANAITKAGIVARESTNAGSPGLHVTVNPLPPGRDLAQMSLRLTENAISATVGSNVAPGALPNAWLRLQRAGTIFTGYHSTNGSNWTIMGQTNVPLGSPLLLGLGLSAHDTNLLATGIFSNFRITIPHTTVALTGATYSNGMFSASFQSEAGVNYQVLYRTNLPPRCALDFSGSCPPDTDVWTPLLTIPGDGTVKTFTDPTVPLPDRRFYIIGAP
ncbi:MAG TPA: immunoglobulin domain-containing protein, partial [Verrucomicrobiae bacterium]